MAKKKKTKKEKRKERIRKSKSWVATYQGADIVRDYAKLHGVDPVCAEQDLEAMKASTPQQRALLKQAYDTRVEKQREEQLAHLIKKNEKRKPDFATSELKDLASAKKAYTAIKEATVKKTTPKRRCPSCGRVMKQQFIGLKHCKCGMSWSKSDGYFERTPNMVFALQRVITKKSKNSIRTKQVPVIRYREPDSGSGEVYSSGFHLYSITTLGNSPAKWTDSRQIYTGARGLHHSVGPPHFVMVLRKNIHQHCTDFRHKVWATYFSEGYCTHLHSTLTSHKRPGYIGKNM